MSNQVTKQAVVKPGGSIDPNKTTEVLQLFDESGDPISLDGAGGGGGDTIINGGNFINVAAHMKSDSVPTTDSFWGTLPAGLNILLNYNHSDPGIYETDGTTTLAPVITGELESPLLVFCSTAPYDIASAGAMFTSDASKRAGYAFMFPVGFDFASSSLSEWDAATFFMNAAQSLLTASISNIIVDPGTSFITVDRALLAINDIIYPEPPASGTKVLTSTDGVLSWENP